MAAANGLITDQINQAAGAKVIAGAATQAACIPLWDLCPIALRRSARVSRLLVPASVGCFVCVVAKIRKVSRISLTCRTCLVDFVRRGQEAQTIFYKQVECGF
jgi:hypothetical protein